MLRGMALTFLVLLIHEFTYMNISLVTALQRVWDKRIHHSSPMKQKVELKVDRLAKFLFKSLQCGIFTII